MLAGIGGLAAGALLAGKANAGPLNPPPGPIAPTPGPEPRTPINATTTPGDANAVYRITQPGSYYLTGNITGAAGKHGIKVVASNVSIDLMGFEIVGTPASLDGVSSDGNFVRAVTVANGGIRDWGQHGVSLAGFYHRAFGVAVSGCGQSGISLALNATFEHCRASGCGTQGFKATDNAVFCSCSAHSNTQPGFEAGAGAVAKSCISQGNAKEGFKLGGASAVRSCVGKDNTDHNFIVGDGATLTNCTATGSTSKGGFSTGSASLAGCVATGNILDGFSIGSGSTLTGCAASSNGQVGISAAFNSTVVDCTAYLNGRDGIRTSGGSLIARNMCANNGTNPSALSRAGIYANGNGVRVEGNNCINNGTGIQTFTGGCFIVRNTCRASTIRNWDVSAGNICLVVNAAPAGAIQGNAGGLPPGSTDPNANFSY